MVGWHHQLSGHKSEETLGDKWRTEESGVLSSTRLQRIRHNLVTEQQQHKESQLNVPIVWSLSL